MELLYTKYNRHRLPRFQIETSIFSDRGKRIVVKKALTPEATSHIKEMAHNYALIKKCLVDNRIRLPQGLHVDEESIRCDYVEGSSLDHMLFQAFLDKDAEGFVAFLDEYFDLLKGAFKTVDQPVITDRLKQVFGLSKPEQLNGETPCFALSLIDPVFENILVSNGQHFLIDNEWVFDGCLPVSFALFRSLFYFYQVKYADFDIESLVSFETVLDRYSLSPETVKRFREMDDHFQVYVFGEDQYYHYKGRYAKEIYSVPRLEETIQHQRGIVRKMHGQISHLKDMLKSKDQLLEQLSQLIKDKDQLLEQMSQLVKDKDQLLGQMTQLIKDKDHLLEQMAQLIKDKDQLISDMVNSRGWKFVQFVLRTRDRLLPSDTWRRRVAGRLCNGLIGLGRLFQRRPRSKS